MAKLELFYPVKPVQVNQAFGIFNPAYEQFGFSRHNGIDYATNTGQLARAMCDGVVADVGENSGAGKFVRYRTSEKVLVDGLTDYVAFEYMHAKEVLVKKGDIVLAGDPLIVCNNTGFSTGPHLHISAMYSDVLGRKQKYGDPESSYCFDFAPYYNKYFAEDAQKIFSIYYKIIALLRAYLNK